MDTSASEEEKQATKITCDVLCSLSSARTEPSVKSDVKATPPPTHSTPSVTNDPSATTAAASAATPISAVLIQSSPYATAICSSHQCDDSKSDISAQSQQQKVKACPKQHQLPLFLSKTYHMIDRCDPEIATWSTSGDNFVVKNLDLFSSAVLPRYFKHSNFSSFARQLNFYGFRKLRSDPILTSDVDPNTENYVRFYHEKFQKDRPDLLHDIKRATKSEQHAKDDVDTLKTEVCRLKECVQSMSTKMERQLAEMSYEYNRRIANLSTEYDKLANLVTQLLQHHRQQNEHAALLHHHHAAAAVAAAGIGGPPSIVEASYTRPTPAGNSTKTDGSPPSPPSISTDQISSLNHAMALRLQQQRQFESQLASSIAAAVESQQSTTTATTSATTTGEKRPAPLDSEHADSTNKKLQSDC